MCSSELPAGTRAPIEATRCDPYAPFDTTAMISIRERERVRLGFDLHDGPAQTMSAALLQIRLLEDSIDAELLPALRAVRETISRSVGEIYAIIDGLDGNRAADVDFITHVRALGSDLERLTDIPVTFSLDGDPTGLSSPAEIVLFRIVQEALSNVRRHSAASHARISLRFDEREASCEVADDGRGFDPAAPCCPRYGREPYGLASMHERAHMLGGECDVDSSPGRGTCIRVTLPRWQE